MTAGQIQYVAVVGAGTMGHGIGLDFARAGYDVALCDVSRQALEQAREQIENELAELVSWGLFPVGEVPATLARITTGALLREMAGDADLVIEAVPENLELKRRVFRELDAVCPARTILASNTSSYMPSMLAAATERQDRVLGLHFFYPPSLIPLVEVVRGVSTSDRVVEAVRQAVEAAGKSPIVIHKEAMGFVANRLQMALLREALFLIEQGIASAQDVDTAVHQGFGRRLAVAGPLEMAEVQDGWDVIREIGRQILPHLDVSGQPSPLLNEKVARGELGPASGRGFYEWTEDGVQAWEVKLRRSLAGFLQAELPLRKAH